MTKILACISPEQSTQGYLRSELSFRFLNLRACNLLSFWTLIFSLYSLHLHAQNPSIIDDYQQTYSGVLGDNNQYIINLKDNEALLVSVSQINADVEIALVNLDSGKAQPLYQLSIPAYTWLDEQIFISSTQCKTCLLKILPGNNIDKPGRYALTFKTIDPSDDVTRQVGEWNNDAAIAWLRAGDNLKSSKNQLISALQLYQKSIEISAAAGLTDLVQLNLYLSSQVEHLLGQYPEQEARLTQLLEIINDPHSPLLLRSIFDLAYIELDKGALDLALEKFKRVEEMVKQQSNELMRAQALLGLAAVASDDGNYQTALNNYEQALAIFQSAGEWRNIINTTLAIGWVKVKLGELNQALGLFHQALSLALTMNATEHAVEANTKLAAVYRILGDFNQANLYIDQALEDSGEFSHSLLDGRAKQEKARVLMALGQFEFAIDVLEEARQAYKSVGSYTDEINIEYFLALVHSKLENYSTALAYAHEVLENDKSTGISYDIGTAYNRLAGISLGLEDYPEALSYQLQALEHLQGSDDRILEAHVLSQSAEIYFHNGIAEQGQKYFEQSYLIHQKNLDPLGTIDTDYRFAKVQYLYGDKKIALTTLSNAIQKVNQEQENISRGDLKRSYLALHQKMTGLYIHLLHSLGENKVDMLKMSEMFRNQTLHEKLRELRSAISVTPEFDKQRRALQNQLETQVISYHSLSDPLEREDVVRNVRKFSSQLQALELRWSNVEKLPQRPTNDEPIGDLNIEQIQQDLSPDSLILYFDTSKYESHLWAISQNAVEYVPLPNEAILSEQINSLMAQIGVMPSQQKHNRTLTQRKLIKTLSHSLFQGLPKHWDQYSNLIIVPDGPLHYLPFSILQLDEEKNLLDMQSISYLFSLRTVAYLSANTELVNNRGSLLLVANPKMQSSVNASPSSQSRYGFNSKELPYTQREANYITSIVGARTQAIVQDNANKQLLLKLPLADFDVLHFATHGISNTYAPSLGGLVLSNLHSEDNLLLAPEIINLRLNANLVVLSACETAVGQLVNGEGLMGLSRAFFEAGAKSVVASLWPVQDKATAELMKQFYHYLYAQKRAPKEALRLAQLDVKNYRKANGHMPWRDPYYWAGFVFQGLGSRAID